MKSQHHQRHPPKLKTTPCRPFFSCGFFRHCTQTALSPTTSTPPTHLHVLSPSDAAETLPASPLPPPSTAPVVEPPIRHSTRTSESGSSTSSSNNTSQSFTQWRFPLPTSPFVPHSYYSQTDSLNEARHDPRPCDLARGVEMPQPPVLPDSLEETFHVAELKFSTGSDLDRFAALHLLELSLVPNPLASKEGDAVVCPATVVGAVVECLRETAAAKSASKILLALCLVESNRHVAVEVGAVGAVVETLANAEGAMAERLLAALELLCTVAEGAAEVRAHALAVPMMVEVIGKMEGRGKESAISVLAVIFSGSGDIVGVAPLEEVALAVALALRGNCSERGRRKGAQILKTLEDNGRLNLTLDD